MQNLDLKKLYPCGHKRTVKNSIFKKNGTTECKECNNERKRLLRRVRAYNTCKAKGHVRQPFVDNRGWVRCRICVKELAKIGAAASLTRRGFMREPDGRFSRSE